MTPFRAEAQGYTAHWDDIERAVIAGVAREVATLLRDQAGLPDDAGDDLDALTQTTGLRRRLDDPAARRLLPDASRDDPAVAAEFRHLTQTDLASAKVRALEHVAHLLDTGADRVLVTRDDAGQVAAALTDIRLVIAQRLDLTTDDAVEALHDEQLGAASATEPDGDRPGDDDAHVDPEVRRYWGGIFVAVGFAQESLVGAMLDEYRARGHLG